MFWKRFVESVTVSLNNYRSDPFFRTEVNVIALQICFALVILGLVGATFDVLYRDVSAAIVDGIRAGLSSGHPGTLAPTIVAEIERIRTQNLATIAAITIGATFLFGFLISRVALSPTRHALAAQKQFIGNIAHEIRTPLAIIKANTELAIMENKVSADLKMTLTSTVEELDRISEIINNLLSLSALVRPERMEFAAVDLSELAAHTVDKYSQLAKQSAHQVTLRRSPHTAVWGNATALEQIVGNLLKNAIRYTPRGGEISITVAPAPGNHIELQVQDSGVGIARKDLFRIFEPFYRAEQSRNRSQGGTGLGLAIVSELLKLHNGKITIRSELGRGTSIVILLPAARTHHSVGGTEMREGVSEVAVDFSKKNQG